jgi:ERCC4-type nuclease
MAFDGAMTAVTHLQRGDLWITASDGALLIVERKTAQDLLASIADGRLFDQVAAMRAMSDWCYVAIQGEITCDHDGRAVLDRGVTNWRWNAIQGALQTAQEAGAVVIYLPDDRHEFERFIIRLAERDRGKMRAGALRQPDLLHPGMVALTGLPGIGLDRAKTLLETFSSAAWALDFLTDENWQSEKVSGFGNGIKGQVREALGLHEGMKLAVMRNEDDQ